MELGAKPWLDAEGRENTFKDSKIMLCMWDVQFICENWSCWPQKHPKQGA